MNKVSKWKSFLFLILFLFIVRGDVEGGEKMIALTFDDGPNGNTQMLLDILEEKKVLATFFVVGKMVEKYPQLLKEIFHRGHEISNHTYSHPDLTTLSSRDVIFELDRTRHLIKEIIGKDPHYFRPPGGRYDKRIIKISSAAGYTMLLWDINTNDLTSPPDEIYHKIISQAQNGDIVLLHNGTTNTIQAIRGIIDELKRRGFAFTTVSEILRRRKNSALGGSAKTFGADTK